MPEILKNVPDIMKNILGQLGASRLGVALVLALASISVGVGYVPANDPNVQVAYGASSLVLIAVGAVLGPKAIAWLVSLVSPAKDPTAKP